MKRKPLDAAQIWADIEEHAGPALSLRPSERVVYFYLVRRTRLARRRKVLLSARILARGTGLSCPTARIAARRLVAKGLLRVTNCGLAGLRIEVFLPREVPGCVVDRVSDGSRLDSLDFFYSNFRRSALYRREAGRCFYCLCRLRREHRVIDHVVPQTRGGANSYRNLVAACLQCNMAKSDLCAADLLRKLFRDGKLSAVELRSRLHQLKLLQRGQLKPILKPVVRRVRT